MTGGGSENAEKVSGIPAERPDGGRRMPDAGQGMPEGMEQGETQESSASADFVSTKALKSYVELIIEDGDFSMDSCDDAIHSNQNVTINGGDFMIQAGDDGIHADLNLTVNDGQIDISQSYEGLEGAEITVNNGDIKVTASDDGINAASDDDSASNPETDEVDSYQNKQRGGFMTNEDQGADMTFNGGTICVNAGGDGLDIVWSFFLFIAV